MSALYGVLASIFVLAGHLMIVNDDGMALVGLFVVAACGLVAVLMFGTILWPCRLTIGPAGLRHESIFRTRTWSWGEIEAIRSGAGRISLVLARKRHPAFYMLFGPSMLMDWPHAPEGVPELLTEAHARWG